MTEDNVWLRASQNKVVICVVILNVAKLGCWLSNTMEKSSWLIWCTIVTATQLQTSYDQIYLPSFHLLSLSRDNLVQLTQYGHMVLLCM